MATYPVEFHRRKNAKVASSKFSQSRVKIRTHDWGEVFCEPQQTER